MAKKKKTNLSPLLIKIFIIFILLVACLVGVFAGVKHTLLNSQYFQVKAIVIDPSLQFVDKKDLGYLKGMNVFKVDLKKVQKTLGFKYPEVSQLKVVRKFPNQIALVAKKRTPVVQGKIGSKFIVLDSFGVVLALSDKEDKDIIVVNGLDQNQKITRTGTVLKDERSRAALEIGQKYLAEQSLGAVKLLKIDVENLSKVYCQLSNGIDVILDKSQIETKIKVLAFLLTRTEIDLNSVKYIDLRYKDPILGKK